MSQDLRLREDVQRELEWEASIHSAEIGVSVREGIVTLMGDVDDYPAKRAAGRAAARARGVRAVSNQLKIKGRAPEYPTDSSIAWAGANALTYSTLVPEDRVRLGVSEGWVTLEGAVDWQFQKTAAEDTVKNLAGVRGVTNLIEVAESVPDPDFKQRIEDVLKGIPGLVSARIIVETARDRATLWGSVNSPEQREAAEFAAWSVPGVSDVANHLTIHAAAHAGA